MVNLASFVIPMGCLWLTRNTMGWNNALADNISANVVGAGLGMVFRFWAFRRFVFKKQVLGGAGGVHVGAIRPGSGASARTLARWRAPAILVSLTRQEAGTWVKVLPSGRCDRDAPRGVAPRGRAGPGTADRPDLRA